MRDTATGLAPKKRLDGEVEMAPVIGSTPALRAEPSSNPTVSESSLAPPSAPSTFDSATEWGLVVPKAVLLFCSSKLPGDKLNSLTVESRHPTAANKVRLFPFGTAPTSNEQTSAPTSRVAASIRFPDMGSNSK